MSIDRSIWWFATTITLHICIDSCLHLQVGTAAAYNHAGLFFARRYFGLLAAAVLVITWLNQR